MPICRLPKDTKRRVIWLKALDPSGTRLRILDGSRICSKHFHDSDYFILNGKRKLKSEAVPSLNLGSFAELPLSQFADNDHPALHRKTAPVCDPWDIPRKVYQRAKKPEETLPKPIKYSVDLKNAHLDKMSPRLAKHVLPKIYNQLQKTTLRLNRYKRQFMYYRKQSLQLKNLLLELCSHHGIPVPKRVWARNRTLQISQMLPPVDSEDEADDDETESDPLAGVVTNDQSPKPVEVSSEDEDDDSDGDGSANNYGARLEDQAVEKLMSVL